MALRLRTASIVRPYASIRPLHITRACYYPQKDPVPNKEEEFFIAASFPDDSGSEPLITKYTSITRVWEVDNATTSEQAVKADRGEAGDAPSTPIAEKELEKLRQAGFLSSKLNK